MIATSINTAGEYATEPEAWAHFDELVTANGAFKMHREVWGDYVQARPNTELKKARIDRLLLPTKSAIDQGWSLGAVAIEGKKSGNDLGKMLAQALDYTRCAWRLRDGAPGLLVMSEWVFVYPVNPPSDTLASLMAQTRIGFCYAERQRVVFGSGGTHGLVLYDDGRITTKALVSGRKTGSRP